MDILLQFVLLIIGFVMLVKGADWFVDGASELAQKLKIPQLIIGLTIVAMGTSMPEAAVSLSAALKGSADITIGNVLGSNIINILIILGVSAAIRAISVDKTSRRYDMPFLILITFLLLLQGLDGVISLGDGIILLGFFIAYMYYLFRQTKASHPQEPELSTQQQRKMRVIILATLIGMGLIALGSNVAVDAATALARIFGMSERFIGLTIVALGTSLPELFTSVSAARKGNSDIAIGNIIGSNIFNILFVIGLSSMIIPVPFAEAFRFDNIIAAAAAGLLLLCCLKGGQIRRWHGIVMLICYALYFIMII